MEGFPGSFRSFPYFTCLTDFLSFDQGVTKRCGPSWLTNSALVYEPKCGGKGGGGCGVSVNEYSCVPGAQINFGDLTTPLTYGFDTCFSKNSKQEKETLLK